MSDRRSKALTSAGWTLALLAVLGIFLGGAGVLMLPAGHDMAGPWVLAGIGLLSTLYLAWFLATVDREPPPSDRSDDALPRSATEIRTRTKLGMATCAGCGARDSRGNRVRPSGKVFVCDRCLTSTVVALGPRWAIQAGLVSTDRPGPRPRPEYIDDEAAFLRELLPKRDDGTNDGADLDDAQFSR